MGSFIGHVLPGSLFLLVGLWHMFCSVAKFAARPAEFRAQVWHPCSRLPGPLYYLELILIILGTFADMVPVELLGATHFRPFVKGAIAPGHLNNFEHAAMLLVFFLFATATLLSETTSLLPLPEGGLHLVAATAFAGEFLLFYFHSASHQGVEGRYHALLALEIGLCVAMAVLCAAHPQSFLIDIGGAVAVTMQGLWFWQTAFSMYGSLIPTGCTLGPDTLHCPRPADQLRAVALANLQLTLHIMCMLVVTLALYGVAMHVWGKESRAAIVAGDYQPGPGAARSRNGHGHWAAAKTFDFDDDEDGDLSLSLQEAQGSDRMPRFVSN